MGYVIDKLCAFPLKMVNDGNLDTWTFDDLQQITYIYFSTSILRLNPLNEHEHVRTKLKEFLPKF